MEVLVIYLLGFLFLAALYLFVPIIFCLCGNKLSKSTIITIVIINGVCVTLLYAFLYNYVFAAICVMFVFGVPFSSFAYWLMKKRCLKEAGPIIPKIEEMYIPKYTSTPIQVKEMSLSPIGETPKKYGNYNVYGKDIMLETPIAPVKESVQTEEPKPNIQKIANKESDTVDIILRLKTDEEFFSAVKTIYELNKEKLSSLLRFLE